MDQSNLANTSKMEKKKSSKLPDTYTKTHKSYKSFWKNLFKKQKKDDIDTLSAEKISRLNAVIEKTKSMENKKEVSQEIEEIKKTIKRISNMSAQVNSILLQGRNYSNTEYVPNEDLLLDYLTDGSSDDDLDLEEEDHEKLETANESAGNMVGLDDFVTNLQQSGDPALHELKQPEPVDNILLKDGYSFEYSESSSTEDSTDDKPVEKVTFDDKVETKDTENNILVKELNPVEEISKEENPKEEIPNEETPKDDTLEDVKCNVPEKSDVQHDEIKIHSDPIKESDIPQPTNHNSKIPIPINPEQQMKSQQVKRSSPSMSTRSTATSTTFPGTSLEQSESLESIDEMEIWSEHLNELTGVNPILALGIIPMTGPREYRLDKYFKMTINDENLLTYTVTFDPVEPQKLHSHKNSTDRKGQTVSTDEKHKVVRKRKMMSLLHDKIKMEECLREIEQTQRQEELTASKNNVFTNDSSIQVDEELLSSSGNTSYCNYTPVNSSIKDFEEKSWQPKFLVTPCVSCNDTVFILERTKLELQKFLDRSKSMDPKVQSLYPENYLEIFNLRNTTTETINKLKEAPSFQLLKNDSSMSDCSTNTSVTLSDSKINLLETSEIHADLPTENNVDYLIQELLLNSAELKETCLLNANINEDESEPLITINDHSSAIFIVEPIINDIFEQAVDEVEANSIVPPGHFGNPLQSFIANVGLIEDDVSTFSFDQEPIEVPSKPFEINLKENEDLLPNLQNASCDYTIGLSLTRQQIINQKIDEVVRTAQDFITTIEQKATSQINTSSSDNHKLEKSRRFGPYYSQKPFEEEMEALNSNDRDNTFSDDNLNVTDSLQHIFIGNPNEEIALQSEFNLVEPLNANDYNSANVRPGTSTTIDKVPAKHFLMSSNANSEEMEDDDDTDLKTIIENNLSGITTNSYQTRDYFRPVMSSLEQFGSGSGLQTNSFSLERKLPDTDLHRLCPRTLDKHSIDKSIEENLLNFQKEMDKVEQINKRTVEMLNCSSFSTPEDSLSIISTITENYNKMMAQHSSQSVSNNNERYPQFISNDSQKSKESIQNKKFDEVVDALEIVFKHSNKRMDPMVSQSHSLELPLGPVQPNTHLTVNEEEPPEDCDEI